MKRLRIGIVILALLCVSSSAIAQSAPDDIVVVGNANTPESLTPEEIKQIFLGKKTRWADDSKITFVIFSEKDAYTGFLKRYINKTYSQYRNYWKKQVFTGKGRMPKAFDSPDELFTYLAETVGAMSFARMKDVDPEQVHVITVK